MDYLIRRIQCYFGKHLWIEWEHGSDRRSQDFWPTTVCLINPECAICGCEKFNSLVEALKGGCPVEINK